MRAVVSTNGKIHVPREDASLHPQKVALVQCTNSKRNCTIMIRNGSNSKLWGMHAGNTQAEQSFHSQRKKNTTLTQLTVNKAENGKNAIPISASFSPKMVADNMPALSVYVQRMLAIHEVQLLTVLLTGEGGILRKLVHGSGTDSSTGPCQLEELMGRK